MVRTDPSSLSDLAPAWDALVPESARLGPFPSALWGRVWWAHFGNGSDLRVATVVRGEELVAIAPLYLESESGTLLFLGGRDITDYTCPVPPTEMDAATGLILECAERDGASVECVSTPDDLGFADSLCAAAETRGLRVERLPTEPAPYVDLPSNVETYFEMLDGKERHELRRKVRRFERELGLARLRRADAITLESDLGLFFEWHRTAPGEKGTFMSRTREAFFGALARELLLRGWLALDILEAGGTPVAAAFSFVIGDTVYLYNSSLDTNAYRWSPGMVLIERLIDRAISDGLARLDFLKGNEHYKFQLGGVARALSSVRVDGR